jgi:tyrosyl-tRNA synthetase
VNVDDRDVGKCLRLFTLLEPGEIAELEALQGADIRQAKRKLAYETTALIHGAEEATRAEQGARALFGGGGDLAEVPSTAFALATFSEALPVSEALARVGLAKSRGEARRLIKQGGVTVNDKRVESEEQALSAADLVDGAILLRVGKKKYHRLVVE